jgi:hypothetical protein
MGRNGRSTDHGGSWQIDAAGRGRVGGNGAIAGMDAQVRKGPAQITTAIIDKY